MSDNYTCWKCQADITEKVARAMKVSVEDLRLRKGSRSPGPVVVVCDQGHRNAVRVASAN